MNKYEVTWDVIENGRKVKTDSAIVTGNDESEVREDFKKFSDNSLFANSQKLDNIKVRKLGFIESKTKKTAFGR